MVHFRNSGRAAANFLSRREQGRLLLLVFALGSVLVLMSEAGKPSRWTWLVALETRDQDTLAAEATIRPPQPLAEPISPPPSGTPSGTTPEPTLELALEPALEPATAHEAEPADGGDAGFEAQPAGTPGSREWLQLLGIGESQLGQFADDRPVEQDDADLLLQLLYRVGQFDPRQIDDWTNRDFSADQLAADPQRHRAAMFALTGRVRKVSRVRLPSEMAARYEWTHYYDCEVQLADGGRAVRVLTPRVPKAWPPGEPLDERVSAAGLFLKRAGSADADARLLFLAPRLAWHPDALAEGSGLSLGMTVLGDMGVDAGLWDEVENRKPFTASDREAFYQLLHAVGQQGGEHWDHFAGYELAALQDVWRGEERRLAEQYAAMGDGSRPASDGPAGLSASGQKQTVIRTRLAVVRHLLERAGRGQFPVVPLFNEPDKQFGRLVRLEGTARRAVKIQLGTSPELADSGDIVERFGIDHYFELEVFPEDSQNNPVVFCLRELPEGFPVGDRINEPVRVAGFFFKSWAYTPQESRGRGGLEAEEADRRLQVAPLIVGRMPTWIDVSPSPISPYAGAAAGGLFVLVLLGVLLTLWTYRRGDARFRDRAIAGRYAPVDGVAMDAMGGDSGGPDFSKLGEGE